MEHAAPYINFGALVALEVGRNMKKTLREVRALREVGAVLVKSQYEKTGNTSPFK